MPRGLEARSDLRHGGPYTEAILTFDYLVAPCLRWYRPRKRTIGNLSPGVAMFPGRNPGSRSLQGLNIKAEFGKLAMAAEHAQGRHRRCATQNWRRKTIQNLAFTIIITIASTVTWLLALSVPPEPIRWTAFCLAAVAPLCTLVMSTRRYPERQAAHLQIANRYKALAASCHVSVTKYEDQLIGDGEFQALLDQHVSDMDGLKRESEPA